jgi:hypothetical protein
MRRLRVALVAAGVGGAFVVTIALLWRRITEPDDQPCGTFGDCLSRDLGPLTGGGLATACVAWGLLRMFGVARALLVFGVAILATATVSVCVGNLRATTLPTFVVLGGIAWGASAAFFGVQTTLPDGGARPIDTP